MGQAEEVPRQLASERYRIEPTRRLGGQQAGNSLQAHIIAQTENVVGSANASRLGIERTTYHGAKPHVLKFGELGGIAVSIVKCADGQQVAAHEDAETERGIYTLALGAVRQRILMRDIELVRIKEPLQVTHGRAARHEAGAEQRGIHGEPERERQQRHGWEQQRQGESERSQSTSRLKPRTNDSPAKNRTKTTLNEPEGAGEVRETSTPFLSNSVSRASRRFRAFSNTGRERRASESMGGNPLTRENGTGAVRVHGGHRDGERGAVTQGRRNLEASPEGGGRAVIADLGTVTRERPQNGTGAERSRVDGERGGIGRGKDGKEQGGAAPSDGTRRRESAEPSGLSNLSNSLALSGTAALPRRYGVQHSKGGRAGGRRRRYGQSRKRASLGRGRTAPPPKRRTRAVAWA